MIPTVENPGKEVWLEAHHVRETQGGGAWDFEDLNDQLVRRLEKTSVESFVVTPDRRKPRPLEHSTMPDRRRHASE